MEKRLATRMFLMVLLLAVPLLACGHDGGGIGVGRAVGFVENAGQWDGRVRLAAQMGDAALFLEGGCLTVALREGGVHPGGARGRGVRCHAYRMSFAGGEVCEPEGEWVKEGYLNFYLGGDPTRWRSHVREYGAARYRGVEEGVDLEVYAASGGVKYNWIVHPGGDAGAAAMVYEGTDGVEVSRGGTLRVRTAVGTVEELKPYAYQVSGGREREVESRWVVSKEGEGYRVGVAVGEYDRGLELVIDPTLVFSTYTGSTADNWGTTGAYDSGKNVYTAGLVFGVGYPVSLGAYDEGSNGNADVGIFKFDSSGGQRLWATYLGGGAADMPHSLYVNMLDELLVFGTTGSEDFPVTAGAYQRVHGGGVAILYEGSGTINFAAGSDMFVSRLSADGAQLRASTYVGGSGNDGLNYRHHYNTSYQTIMGGNDSLYYNYGDGARGEVITDDLGNVYVGSTTMSGDFPTTGGVVQGASAGGQEGVALKLDYNLRRLVWSTYLGGSGDDAIYSIDLDSSYNLLVCGGTTSRDFPTTAGGYQRVYGGGSADGFVSKVSADGGRLMGSTFVGSGQYDQVYFVRTGRRDEVFLFGQTRAEGSTMIYNAGYGVPGAGMLLARLEPDLGGRRWSTVFGTPGRVNLSPTAFAADICNRVYAAGWGRDFVGYNGVQWYTMGTTGMETTAGAYQDSTDGQDFYVMSLDADAGMLEYATFFGELHEGEGAHGGGDHVDGGTSRFDRLATLYQSVCASCGGTQGFPTTAGAWSDSNRSTNCNNAIFRFNVTDDFPVAEFLLPPTGCAPYTVDFRNTGRGTAFLWLFGDGGVSTEANPTHTYAAPGRYEVTLVAAMPGGCTESDTMRYTVHVLSDSGYAHTPLVGCGGSTQIGFAPTFGATYQWTGNGVSDPTVSNPWVEESGVYVLHTSAAGCTQRDTFRVEYYTLVESVATGGVSCRDTADGTAAFVLGGGVEQDSVSYGLVPGAAWRLSGDSIVYEGLRPGTSYTFTMAGYGCGYEHTFSLPNPEAKAYVKETSAALCSDSCAGWIHLWWDEGGAEADSLMEGLCEGVYATVIATADCPISDTTTIARDHGLDSLRAWADAERVYIGEGVGLHAGVAGNGEGVMYSWFPPSEVERPLAQHTRAFPTDTLSCYTVRATTKEGCSGSASVCVRGVEVVCGEPEFKIPNAFTPNGDGLNDRVCFNAEAVTKFHIAIFNRWGEKVYESEDATECWDGSYRGHACLPGVYTYTCHIRCHADEENDFKGDITLIR